MNISMLTLFVLAFFWFTQNPLGADSGSGCSAGRFAWSILGGTIFDCNSLRSKFRAEILQSQIGHPWRIASQIAAHPLPESAKTVNAVVDVN
jgi:hypothetical protein